MSLKPQPIPDIPEETARVAQAVFPKGNTWLRLRDQLGTIYEDDSFASLFSTRGQPAEAPWRLALVSVMQFAEGLSDRQAADAVRCRIDWKYLLALPLDDPGFDSSVLCEFRARLISGEAEESLLTALLQVCRQHKLLSEGGRQRTDSTHVLAAVSLLNRLENVATTLRLALNALAIAAPEWLRLKAAPEWVERYSTQIDEYMLPKSKEARIAYAETVGGDGHKLLAAIYDKDAPEWLRKIPVLETLRQVWVQQYYYSCEGVRWRTAEETGLPSSAVRIQSPIDVEARYSDKRSVSWVGYKVHLTESCDQDKPRLITQVETTPATVPDHEVIDQLHEQLSAKKLLPKEHLVDSGYINAELLVRSRRDWGVELCGPARPDTSWQAKAGKGYAASDFIFDWEQKQAICPQGQCSSSWQATTDRYGKEQIKIKFSVIECRPCVQREECTRIERRILTIRPKEEFLALEEARQREKTSEYAEVYKKRAGVEGSLSQAVRSSGMRRARYVGLAKTHLQNVLTAVATNAVRIANWMADLPLEKTRRSAFAKLMCPVPSC